MDHGPWRRGGRGQAIRGRGRPFRRPGAGRGHHQQPRLDDNDVRQGNGERQPDAIWPIGYKKLEDKEKNETPRNIVIWLSGGRCGLEQRLRGDGGNLQHGMTQMLLKVFGKMSESDGPNECLVRVLQLILKYDFHERIAGIVTFNHASNRRAETMLLLDNALKLMNTLLTVIPSTAEKKVRMTMMMISSVLDKMGDLSPSITESNDQINTTLKMMEEKQRKKTERAMKRETMDDLHSQQPPDDYRGTPVFPQLSDIHSDEKPFLRTNLINRAYESVEHYLDVQFRLLREDFIRPLREGINEIIKFGDMDQRRRRYQNVKVYENVIVEYAMPDQKGILHRIHFNAEKLRGVRWRNTKRLLYGNLLCLSSDQFRNEIHFAVVADRRPEDLADGYLTVQFVTDTEIQEDDDQDEEDDIGAAAEERNRRTGAMIDFKKIYAMVETDAYFEAYRHVLAGLKETETVPLDRYIVQCSQAMQAPKYLRPAYTGEQVTYDFSPVTNGQSAQIQVLSTDGWPSSKDLGLNETQTDAFKLALTNELAIIQGPPGTGKTYVGLAIMKILLKNKNKWFTALRRRHDDLHCPILVVCYTNHALDQFLEGIAKFSSEDHKIIRVGGRSKNEVTQKFSLSAMRHQRRANYRQNATLRHTMWTVRNDMRALENELGMNTWQLEASMRCIQKMEVLESVIPLRFYNQFQPRRGYDDIWWRAGDQQTHDTILLDWLGVYTTVEEVDFNQIADNLPQLSLAILYSLNHSKENIGRAYHATGLEDAMMLHDWIMNQSGVGQEPEEVAEAGEEVLEEADLHQEQRLLDTDQPGNRGRAKTAEENEKQVQRMMKQMAALTFQDVGQVPAGGAEGGWQRTRHDRRKEKQKILWELGKTTTMSFAEEDNVINIFQLRAEDRWRLYRTWVSRWRDKFRIGFEDKIEKYNSLARQLAELQKQEDAEILQEADVVAVTTTGAAKYRDLIYKLNTKIVIVEEAAEVLEAHIITSMPRHTEHLILIGDHQQLKPSPTVYELAKKYNLDTSLFERLINVKVPHVTLNCQHRMRPDIADLLRPHVYSDLQDHQSVLNRGEITGVEKSLYFLSHNVPEENLADGKSKKNQYEADFLVAFCKYLIMQEYEPEQITILAMYTGQLFAFRNKMREEVTRGVRVTAVDNFQGEENDIILLSLVRSNEEEKIGFLSVENRICVALSRAKSALYCIGNMDLLESKSSMWRKVISVLRQKECIGETIALQCKHHPDKITAVKTADDFHRVPEGGCGQPCGARLDCGHVCTRPCHPEDHTKYQCLKQCDKILPCQHRCKRKCFQACGYCSVKVKKTLDCGHEENLDCSQDPKKFQCRKMIENNLPCGHRLRFHCYQSDSPLLKCNEKCEVFLDCDHTCKGSCSTCYQGRLHVPCATKCDRTLVCGHACKSYCSSCPPCDEKCKTSCRHSNCNKTCGEPCILCREKCEWKCPHFQCTKLCSEPCDRPPCNQPCQEKIKKCSHPCIGLCGEPCPTLCRVCDAEKVKEIFFGDEDEETARFVLLEDCGHIFTNESLDQWMKRTEEGDVIKMKECPKCKTIIWRNTRYGNIINNLINSVNQVKSKMWGNVKLMQRALCKEIEEKATKSDFFRAELDDLKEQIKKTIPQSQLHVLELRFRRLLKLAKIREAKGRLYIKIPSGLWGLTKEFDAIGKDLKAIAQWACLHRPESTERDEVLFQRETDRIKDALKFVEVYHNCKQKLAGSSVMERVTPHITELKRMLLVEFSPYVEARKGKVKKLFDEISKQASGLSSNLGISEEEREMICKAMGFGTKGHWYKCSKGHVYAIGDCGGATMTSKCPECNEEIGGTGHQLLSTNRVATEMDGATRPAYDPQMNYIPDNLMNDLRRQGFGL